jgi:hypothetical protein
MGCRSVQLSADGGGVGPASNRTYFESIAEAAGFFAPSALFAAKRLTRLKIIRKELLKKDRTSL